jgi:hypothetical protein
MKLLEALAIDPSFFGLGDRKAVAVELIVRELDAIKAGDENYPSHWLRIIDIARQEAGLAPHSIIND